MARNPRIRSFAQAKYKAGQRLSRLAARAVERPLGMPAWIAPTARPGVDEAEFASQEWKAGRFRRLDERHAERARRMAKEMRKYQAHDLRDRPSPYHHETWQDVHRRRKFHAQRAGAFERAAEHIERIAARKAKAKKVRGNPDAAPLPPGFKPWEQSSRLPRNYEAERRRLGTRVQRELAGFYGSETLYRRGRVNITDGVRTLEIEAGAHWLTQLIDSWQGYKRVRAEEFQVWYLIRNKTGSGAKILATDGHVDDKQVYSGDVSKHFTQHLLAQQRIAYTDFPLDWFKLYVVSYPGQRPTVMLPSEY